jgi:hypothetical protein
MTSHCRRTGDRYINLSANAHVPLALAFLLTASISSQFVQAQEAPATPAPEVPNAEPPLRSPTPPARETDIPNPTPDAAPVTGVTSPEGRQQSANEARIAPPPAFEPPPPSDPQFKLDVGGGMILFYNQPIKGSGKGTFDVFEAKIRIDAEFGMFGLHLVPIARDTKERAFFPGTAWVQEAYAFAKLGPVKVKAGKVWAQFGRFWDNSFYGNVQEYDGLKLDPNNGISIEGNLGADQRLGLVFFAQYFITDGSTNYSLPGRDTVSIPGGRRRNYLVGRVEPFIKLGDFTTLKLGLSGGYFQADLPGFDEQNVGRFAVDGTVMLGALTVWGEYTHQIGRQTLNFPFPEVTDADGNVTTPGRSANRTDYAMVGGEYTLGRITLRYNYNLGSYNVGVKETRHIPGIAVALDEHLFVLLEWALEHRYINGNSTLLGSSLNLTIHGKV